MQRRFFRITTKSAPSSLEFRAFTLIELLVVIAIVALLAAILFPVFNRARENARRAACQSNMKQIGMAVLQYSQDYDERLPVHYVSPSYITLIPLLNATSIGSVINYANDGATEWRVNWIWALQPYTKSWQVFRCPSALPAPASTTLFPSYPTTPNGNNASSYVANALVVGRGIKHTLVFKPSEMVMVQEGEYVNNLAETRPWTFNRRHFYQWLNNGPNTMNTLCAGGQPCGYNRMHFEGGNLLFADGHVKWRMQKNQKPSDYGLRDLPQCGTPGLDTDTLFAQDINQTCVVDTTLTVEFQG